jgi:PAS domain S-box-containing protein
MAAAACLTLGFMQLFMYMRTRDSLAKIFFFGAAIGAAGSAIFELIMFHATTVPTYSFAIRYSHIPIYILLVSLVWFVDIYFKTAQRWLAYLITGLWSLILIINFTSPHSLVFKSISGLRRVSLPWGEEFSLAYGPINSWVHLSEATSVLIIIYLVDASLRLWRQGGQRRALVIGGSVVFFMIVAGIHTPLVDASILHMPYIVSFAFLAIVVTMSFELISDAARTSVLSQEIIVSESRLRSILENVDLLVIELDNQGIVNYINPYAQQLIGLPQEDISGKDWINNFVVESQRETAHADFKGIEEKDIHYHHQNAILIQNGGLRQIAWSCVRMRDRDYRTTGVVSIGADITELIQSREALEAAYAEVQKLKEQLKEENIYLQEEIFLDHNYKSIIGKSDALKYTLARIDQVAQTDMTVLIEGETGVGKELFARAVHQESRRKEHPLVKINCAAIPRDLIESELFGHVKGAFTGADRDRKGRFELADGSTIFLDEIGELPLDLQPKLLRVLEEGEFERLGSNLTKKVDVRIIVATNRVLKNEIEAGRFREDLYFRLYVFPISIPPLRQRLEDIPFLVEFFVDKYSRKLGKKIEKIPKQALEALADYSWPGNIRELSNLIERAVMTTQGTTLQITESLHESTALTKCDTETERLSLEELERKYITEILQECNWRIEGEKGASKILQMHPNTLRNRIQKLGVQRPS